MTVSIIIPVYNAEPWIDQCVSSVRLQSYQDIEVILVDDGSTDKSKDYCDYYLNSSPKCISLHTPNRGVSAARNAGLKVAQGKYVMFVDADDYISEEAIPTLVDNMEGMDLVCGSFRKFGAFESIVSHENATLNMWEVAMYAMGNLKNPRMNQLLSGCWAKLYRMDKIGKFPLITTAEDMALNFDYLTRCDRVKFIPEIVYHNRKRPGSLTTTYNENDKPGLFGFLEGLKYVRKFLSKYYTEAELEQPIDNSKVYHSALYFMRACQITGVPMNDMFKRLYP